VPPEKNLFMSTNRRKFLQQLGVMTAGAGIVSGMFSCNDEGKADAAAKTDTSATTSTPQAPWFEISLAQWSLHKKLFAKEMDNLDFPAVAKNTYGITIVEYVNQFFKDKAKDEKYLNELLKRCSDNGIKNQIITSGWMPPNFLVAPPSASIHLV
jgi:hypothetical protein